MTLLLAAMIGILATMVLALARSFLGPTLYDRILAINMFGTKTVIFVALIGFLMGRPQFLDIALFYALVNFVGIIAVLKLSHYRELDAVQSEEDVR
ncbi:MAG TPA: monovalent cation/H+ antiporter complex subunit F [Actinophytocola sp.]|jgi:multicomponent Na+:H+ antiporter subunit F|nr:monovalent cation/H+ antiporter complex subunit F [Actinophytocola sp.]